MHLYSIEFLCLLFGVTTISRVSGFVDSTFGRSRHHIFKLSASQRFFDPSQWYSFGDCVVLFPEEKVPKSIVHFVGGFLAGSAVPIAYSSLLTTLSENGHLIVATPIPAFETNHTSVADNVARSFQFCYSNDIKPLVGPAIQNVPIIGLSHSLGGKLMVLVNSIKKYRKSTPTRAGNIFLAINNYGFKQSLDLSKDQASKINPEASKVIDAVNSPEIQKLVSMARNSEVLTKGAEAFQALTGTFNKPSEQSKSFFDAFGVTEMLQKTVGPSLKKLQTIADEVDDFTKEFSSSDTNFQLEFIPSPDETWSILLQGYNVQRNVLFKFSADEIDQSNELALWLRRRGCDVEIVKLPGNHLTPNSLSTDIGISADLGSKDIEDASRFRNDLVSLVNSISNNAWGDLNQWFDDSGFLLPP